MAYQNRKHHNRNHYGSWSPDDDYQYETIEQPAYPKHHHHHKGRAAFSTIYEEPLVEAYPKVREPETENSLERYQRARLGDNSAFESVDQEADAFIQHEHRRMELAKLMSMRAT